MKVEFILKLLLLPRAAPRTGEDFPGEERWSGGEVVICCPAACWKLREEGEGARQQAEDGLWLFPGRRAAVVLM